MEAGRQLLREGELARTSTVWVAASWLCASSFLLLACLAHRYQHGASAGAALVTLVQALPVLVRGEHAA